MPIQHAAIKALRKSRKLFLRNKNIIENIRYSFKHFQKEVSAKNEAKAKELAQKSVKLIDKAVQKGILKLNNGSRKKSRLWKKFHQTFKK